MINEDEQGSSFDKTVIGPSKHGSANASEVAGSTSPGEPTVLLAKRGASGPSVFNDLLVEDSTPAGGQPARTSPDQKTVILARRPNTEKALPKRTGQATSIGLLFPEFEPGAAGSNPIFAAANPILVATKRLRHGWRAGPLIELGDRFAQAVETAMTALRHSGRPDDDIRRTKLVLCELIDETILDLGERGPDSRPATGMMQTFFQTGYAGTGFFETLNELLADPRAHRDMLEFMHACLCLGFMGQYRGRREADLGRIRNDLRETLRALSSDPNVRLSSLAAPYERTTGGWMPLLAITLGAAAVTGAIYLGMWVVLDGEASAVTARLDALSSLAVSSTEDGAVGNPAGVGARDGPN